MRKTLFLSLILLALSSVAFGQTGCLLTLETESLPTFFLDQPAHFQIVAVSGTEPYTFEIVQGELPQGLHMNRHGKITGVPRVETLDTVVFVQVTDANGCTITHAYQVYVEQQFTP